MMGADVVVCYSSKDREKVIPFVEHLRSMGISVWIDHGGIVGASPWRKKIVESIKGCKVLVLMASTSSVISDNVVREVTLASEKKKHILPLDLEPVEMPESMEYQLIGIQHIELFRGDRESNFQAIAQSLRDLGVKIEESSVNTTSREPQATVETDLSPLVPVVEPEWPLNESVPAPKIGASYAPPPSAQPTIRGPSAPLSTIRSEKPSPPVIDRHARNRTMVIAVVAFISIVAVVLVVWFIKESRSRKQALTESQPSAPQVRQTPDQPTPPHGMVYVRGGTFMMGRDQGDDAERPAHQVTVAPFYIDLYEVTNEDYEKFLQATSHRAPMTWTNAVYPSHAAHKPVTGVTWGDANAYARWAKKRLPSEEEWEFAARGGADNRLYPWGNEWEQGSANANEAGMGMADVGSYRGTSPFGAFDMVGNAWEWTSSDLHAYPGGRRPVGLPAGDLKIIRGGTYDSTKEYATTTYRTGWPTHGASTYAQTGFRCAADITR
jgi:formylglycine-generating enzyme required for sulfatase activity